MRTLGIFTVLGAFVLAYCKNHTMKAAKVGRKMFFDFGANDGSSVKYFITGEKGGHVHTEGSDRNGGSLRSSYLGRDMFKEPDWNLFVFEANNRYTAELTAQRDTLLKQNIVKSYKLFNGTAISAVNGHLSFTFDTAIGDAGATLMTDSYSARGQVVQVAAVDVDTLFRDLKIVEEDYVVVKMDIEGSEYAVVKQIIVCGWLPFIDRIAVEWHHENIHVFGADGRSSQERRQIHEKYKNQYNSIMWILKGTPFMDRFSEWA